MASRPSGWLCLACDDPLSDSDGLAVFRTDPRNGRQECYHYKCAKCDVCGLKERHSGACDRILLINGVLAHEPCLKCYTCVERKMQSTTILNSVHDFVRRIAFVSLPHVVYHDGHYLHPRCVPCSVCNKLDASEIKTYTNAVGEKVRIHPGCRACSECGERHLARYEETHLSIAHPHCAKCKYCKQPFDMEKIERKQSMEEGYFDLLVAPDGSSWHFECIECTGCHKRLPYKKGQLRKMLFEINQFWHSDCLPCYRCGMAQKGKHLDIFYQGFRSCPAFGHKPGKCPKVKAATAEASGSDGQQDSRKKRKLA